MRATPNFDFALGENADMIRETTMRYADERIARPPGQPFGRVSRTCTA